MKKRALSWLLALTMLLTLAPQALPVWASATGETGGTATQTESKLSANTYSALGLSRSVSLKDEGLNQNKQPYGDAIAGNTVATNVINELYVNFNGSIHYGWSILDNIPMEYRDNGQINNDWTSSDNFYGAMGYWRPNQQQVNYKSGKESNGALFAENGSTTGGEHKRINNSSDYINSANKHIVYQYSKSEAFSPNTGKDNYVAEMVLDTDNNVWLYIYQVEGGNKRYVRGANLGKNDFAGDKNTVIWNWEYDAMLDIAAGDMDGDGYDEIAVYSANKVSVYSYKNNQLKEIATHNVLAPGDREHSTEAQYKKLGSAIVTLAFGDLDADDKDELVIAENMPYWSHNIEKGTVRIYALENKKLEPKHKLSLQHYNETAQNDHYAIRYVNVATGDIDGDNKDELIAAGYYSGYENYAKCSRDNIWYNIVKVEDGKYKNSGWKSTEFKTQDLLGRVVDNEKQLIPPVSLTCAATQGVGYAEQVFLGGCLYTVNKDNGLEYLTRISTNREYKKDNGNKANKEEIFVVNVVAGNFNGNRNGQEQIVYAFGMKHDDSDRYWYDIGYINKKNPGNSDSDYWYGQEQVMNFESSYNRDQNKRRASLYLSLAAVDCDNDSTLMRYKGQTVTWTKPEVLTVLQSAPYFQDLQDTRDYINQGQTAYGKGYGTGDKVTTGASLKVGTYVSYEQDFSIFGVKVASIQAEAQSTHEFEYGFEAEKQKSIDITYSGSAGDDYAVVYAVPYMEYQYETWVPGYTVTSDNLNTYIAQKLGKAEGEVTDTDRQKVMDEFGITIGTTVEGSWQASSVMVPMEPKTVLISVDAYDKIAEQTEGLEPIRGNILNSTPGEPATYDTFGSRSGFERIGTDQAVTTGKGGNISIEGSTETTKTHNFNYSYEFEAKLGAGAGGLTVGVLGGFGANVGGGFSESTSKSCAATVDNLPSDANKYGFDWRFGTREATLNGNPVLVLEYQLSNVAQPPSMPRNLRVDSVTSNSVTLKWDKVTGAGAYKIYQRASNNKIRHIATVPGTAESYTDTNVNPNNTYTYCVQNVSQVGGESIYSTDVRAITLTDANGNFVIKQQPGDLRTYVGGTATTTVEAEYLKNGQSQELKYYWERYNTKTKTWDDDSNGSPQLSVSVRNDTVDGTKYRCQVYFDSNLYIYTDPVTLTIGKANSATQLGSSVQSGATVNASYVKTEKKKTGVEDDVPVKVTIGNKTYTKYTKENVEVYLDKDGKYYSISGETATQLTKRTESSALTYNTGSDSDTITVNYIPYGSLTKDNSYSKETSPIKYTYIDEDNNSIEYTADEKYGTGTTGSTAYKCIVPNTTTEEAYDFWFVVIGDNKYAADLETKTTVTVGDKHIPIDELTLATEQKETETVEETYKEGDKVTLTATPSDPSQPRLKLSGKVVFKIVNSIGDGSKTVDATIGGNGTATAEWIPTAAGVYTITAAYEGNEKYMGSVSSQTITINVVVPGQKTLMIDSPNSMTYGDAAIELKTTLLKGAKNSESASVETNLNGVTYSVKNADGTAVPITGSRFTPTAAGTYTVTATYTIGSETLTATKSIVVNKRTVTIVPKVDKDTKNTSFEPVGIANDTDKALFSLKTKQNQTGNVDISCAGINTTAAGEYRITVTYTATPEIDKNYIVVCDNTQVYEIKDNVVKVTNATNSSNGSVELKYSLKDSNDLVSVYGTSMDILRGSKLIAVASPKAGYKLAKWTINDQPVYLNQVDGTYNTSLTYTVSESLDKAYTVEAEFKPVYYTLSFSVQNNDGSITANYWNGTTTEGTFQYGGNLSPLQSVQLTANMSGKAIKGWKITRGTTEEIVQVNGKNYTGASYILSNISADTTVTVLTDDVQDCPVTISLVDADGKPLVNEDATVSFGDTKPSPTNGTYTYNANKHDNLTVTLTLPAGLIVEEWKDSTGKILTDGTLSNGKKTWTISDLSQGYTWTVKCNTANSFQITTETKLNGDTSEGAGATAGTISVYRAGQDETTGKINSGDKVLQATSLRVVVTPETGYQLLSVTCNGKEKGTTGDFTINGVNKDTTIVATFVKKPVVTIENADTTKGTVTVTGTVNGQSGTPNPYADYQTALEILLKPQVGYVVEGIKLNDGTQINTTDTKFRNDGRDDYKYITDALTADVKITPVWHKLSEYTVTFSIDTTGDGEHGSLKAKVSRKAADGYAHAGYNVDNFTSNNTVYAGSDVTFTAAPATGYRVQEWKVNGEVQKDNGLNITANTLTLSNITEAKTVTVQFMQVGSKVTAAAGNNGSITSGKVAGKDVDYTGGFTLAENAQATFTAQPETGYEVDQWLVNGEEKQSAGTTFNYTAASGNTGAAITVIFRQIEYQVKWTAEHGTVTVSGHTGESATIRGGEELSFTASPADGYTLIDWKVNGERQNSHATSFQWTVPNGAAMSPAVSTFVIEPVFSRGTYAVTITKPDHASITANKQNLSAVTGGEEVTFTAAPEDGYILIGWTVNGTTTNTRALTHKVEVNKATTVTAVIVPSHYAITYQADNSANGTVSVEGHTENPVNVAYGENITFKAEPKNYYHVAGWKVDDTMQPNSANKDTFTLENVTATQTVTAVFGEAVRYTVSYQVEGGNGSLSAKAGGENLTLNPDQTTPVLGGTKLVFTAAPNNGYMVKEWKIDGSTVEGNLSNKLEIGSLEKKTIVTVSFEPLKLHTITANGTECEIKDVIRTPSDYGDDTHVRDRGTVSFKVVPTKASMGLQGLPENAKVVYNSDGSYTVTVTNVTSGISFQMKEYQAKTGNLQIPSEYTESTLKSALRKQIHSSVSGSDIAYLDIKLQIKTGSNPDVWEDVTSANFPQGGIDITILYSALGQSGLDSSYNYSVAHMLENGTVENLSAKGGTSGVTFHVNSLSPFAIGWYKASSPSGGGGGGGAVSTYTLTFDTNGGSAIDKITKDSGTTIDLAAYKPTRAGYTFAGWFSDKALTKAVTSVKLTANTTVYAKWTQNGGTAQNPFVDVKEGAYYYDAVLWAVEQKITSGTSATTFSPDASCTRAQMVTFLWRAAGSPKVENGKNPFTDVKADAYYYDAVLWAVEKGVTSGTSATTFSPDATVTRGQTVTFLYRNAGSPEVSGTMPFTDVEADAYYAKAVQWAVQQKITTGTSETTFSPMSDCTRGQIVTFLYRAK